MIFTGSAFGQARFFRNIFGILCLAFLGLACYDTEKGKR